MELFFGDGIFCGKVLDKPCPVCYNSARRMCSDEENMRVWRNWQTRMIQVHIEAIRWRFKSSYPHHEKGTCEGKCLFSNEEHLAVHENVFHIQKRCTLLHASDK